MFVQLPLQAIKYYSSLKYYYASFLASCYTQLSVIRLLPHPDNMQLNTTSYKSVLVNFPRNCIGTTWSSY